MEFLILLFMVPNKQEVFVTEFYPHEMRIGY
jgi:hypothetical protein